MKFIRQNSGRIMDLCEHDAKLEKKKNIEMISQEIRPFEFNNDQASMAESVPDLIDPKYLEYRRPWYVNPEYKGPRNSINMVSLSQSLHNIKSMRTQKAITKPKVSKEVADFTKQHNINYYNKDPGKIMSGDENVMPSHQLPQNSSHFSFDNLLNVESYSRNEKNKNLDNSYLLSSSPESAFSVQNSIVSSDKSCNVYITDRHVNPICYPVPKNKTFTSPKNCIKILKQPSIVSISSMPWVNNKVKMKGREETRNSSYSSSEPCYNQEISHWTSEFDDEVRDKQFWSDDNQTSVTSSTGNLNLLMPPKITCRSEGNNRRVIQKSFNTGSCDQKKQSTVGKTLFFVFSYLDTKSLARCGAVCRLWYSVSRSPELWKRIKIKNATISSLTLRLMNRWSTQVIEINLQNITISKSSQTLKAKPNSPQKEFEENLEKIIETNKTTLEIFRIVDCDEAISGNIFWVLSIHCSIIKQLIYLSKKNPLGTADLYPLGKGCRKLTSLIIPPGWPCLADNKFSDECCETIGKCWPKLQVLCIGGRSITTEGLIQIAKGCLKLCKLEIDHGPEITEDAASKMVAFGLRGLERLDFTFTPISPRAVALFNSACPRLKHIGIRCTISDYFPNSSPKSKASFNSLKTLFKRLKLRPGFSTVLDVNLDNDPDP